MGKRVMNGLYWRSEDGLVTAERLRGGVELRVTAGSTFIGNRMDTAEADSLARWMIDCGIAERAETPASPNEGSD